MNTVSNSIFRLKQIALADDFMIESPKAAETYREIVREVVQDLEKYASQFQDTDKGNEPTDKDRERISPFDSSNSIDLHRIVGLTKGSISAWQDLGNNLIGDGLVDTIIEIKSIAEEMLNRYSGFQRSVANTPNSSNGDGKQMKDTDVEKLAEECYPYTNYEWINRERITAYREAFIAGYNAAKQKSQ